MNEQMFDISQFGPRLGTRLEGEKARARLVAAIEALPRDGRIIISLQGIDVLSGSFADEVIGKAYQGLVAGLYEERTMILRTPSLELTDDLAHKLERRKLAMLCLANGRWSLLGQYGPELEETLDLIIERKTTTARDLAAVLNIAMNTCANRVARLAHLRLIVREQIGMNGPQPVYQLHSILDS